MLRSNRRDLPEVSITDVQILLIHIKMQEKTVIAEQPHQPKYRGRSSGKQRQLVPHLN